MSVSFESAKTSSSNNKSSSSVTTTTTSTTKTTFLSSLKEASDLNNNGGESTSVKKEIMSDAFINDGRSPSPAGSASSRPGSRQKTHQFEGYLNALLADLQTTVTSPGGSLSRSSGYSSPYNSSSLAKQNETFDYNVERSALGSRGDAVRETTTTKTMYRAASPVIKNAGNMSELDSLLQDLSSSSKYAPVSPASRELVYNGNRPSSRSSVGSHERHVAEPFLDDLANGDEADGKTRITVERKIQRTFLGPAASPATRELDDLMASLSDVKLKEREGDERTVQQPKKATQLDSMLGNLQASMDKQGVAATQKGVCAACHKPIVGQVVTALGKTWHPEHFSCAHCRKELGSKNFYEREGQPYCEDDYHQLYSPRCAYCNGPILDKCVTALDVNWHPEHFFCAHCGKQFGQEGFHEKDGKPYCRSDYLSLFAPKCGGCSKPITDNYITALNAQWHPECFVCRDCRQPFQGGSFFDHEGQPYCETHYHAKRGTLCAGCHKPISGRCITAMFRKFHPEHFVCSFCLKHLNKGTFKEQNDKPYCHGCFDKLFG